MPDATFGLNLTANYKGFDFSMFMQSCVGNEIANALVMDIYSSEFGQWNMSKKMMNRWHGEGTTNVYPRLIASDPNENARFSDRYVEDGSYLQHEKPPAWLYVTQHVHQEIQCQQTTYLRLNRQRLRIDKI